MASEVDFKIIVFNIIQFIFTVLQHEKCIQLRHIINGYVLSNTAILSVVTCSKDAIYQGLNFYCWTKLSEIYQYSIIH